ncbi:unnamed protein product [Victoria cruziana]
MIGRADIEGSKSNVAMNAWLLHASYPCGNFSNTSSFKFRRSKGSIGHAFTVCIRTGNQNQTSFYPFVPHEIFVLVELILGHLHYLLTDVPPQPNSPLDNVFRPVGLHKADLGTKRRGNALLNQKASSSGVLKNPFPAHEEGQASVSLIEVVAPIHAKPLDFFSLFSGQNTSEQNGSSNSSSSQDDLENIIPRAFFELLEEILPPLMDSPPRPTFKVNTSLPFRIKQERFEPEDIWNVGWYACQPIIFTDEDLPAGGMHTNALHLRVSIMGVNIFKVLVDGGASVNVCPLRTIQEIGI